jgi:6-pyruvoyltetrahydropterin/6-carboxytetrahydropterin synthase
MLKLTKIFHFETAHAIHGYEGACKNIHGHSYELHVTVTAAANTDDYIPAPGFVIDFKEIKKVVKEQVIVNLDHKLLLSKQFISENKYTSQQENIKVWDIEPTAENLLLYIKKVLTASLPATVKLSHLKLYETKDSYAEWCNFLTI